MGSLLGTRHPGVLWSRLSQGFVTTITATPRPAAKEARLELAVMMREAEPVCGQAGSSYPGLCPPQRNCPSSSSSRQVSQTSCVKAIGSKEKPQASQSLCPTAPQTLGCRSADLLGPHHPCVLGMPHHVDTERKLSQNPPPNKGH